MSLFNRKPNFVKLREKGKQKKLEKLLSHTNPYYRWRALITLMCIKPKGEYIPVLKDFMSQDEAGGIKQLGDFIGYQSYPGLRVIEIDGITVNSGLDWERDVVVKALAHVACPAAIPLFLHALNNPECSQRWTTASVLRDMSYEPTQKEREVLTKALIQKMRFDPESRVRASCAGTLGRFGDSALLPDLKAVAKDVNQDLETRRVALKSSTQIKKRQAASVQGKNKTEN